MTLPASIQKVRSRIVKKYIGGTGLEIGALHQPTPVPWGVRVSYVDRLPEEKLRAQYPELQKAKFARIGIIDDGEVLSSVKDGSQDFIIANHMLEHCEDPIGTFANHLKKIRLHGLLYYAVPDKRQSFDVARSITPFTHLVADHADAGQSSRLDHHLEWCRLVNQISDESVVRDKARQNIEAKYSIHFHVWDTNAWLEFLHKAAQHISTPYEVLHFEYNAVEIISVIRRM